MTRNEAIDFIYFECEQILYDKNTIVYLDGSDGYAREDPASISFMIDDVIVGEVVKTYDGKFFVLEKESNGNYSFHQYINELKEYCDIVIKEYDYRKNSINMKDKYEFEVKEDKRLRKELDDKIQEIKSLPVSRERDISITKLQEAVMWLGMDLKRLGESNPYPSSKDPSTGTKIEPTADGLKF